MHCRDHGGEGLTVIEPDGAAGFLMEIAAAASVAEQSK